MHANRSIHRDLYSMIDFIKVIELFLDRVRSWQMRLAAPVAASQLVETWHRYQWLDWFLQESERWPMAHAASWQAQLVNGMAQKKPPEHFVELFDSIRQRLLSSAAHSQHLRASDYKGLEEAAYAQAVAGMPTAALTVLDDSLMRVACDTEAVPIERCFNCHGSGGEPCDNRDGHQGQGTCVACEGARYVSPKDNRMAQARLAAEAAKLEERRQADAKRAAQTRPECWEDH